MKLINTLKKKILAAGNSGVKIKWTDITRDELKTHFALVILMVQNPKILNGIIEESIYYGIYNGIKCYNRKVNFFSIWRTNGL